MLKYILLGFLNYHPMSGYDLKSLMDDSTAHFWHAYHSQIYTTLRKLEEDGLLDSEEIESEEAKLNRRVYTLTDLGRKKFADWQRQVMTDISPVKEDLLVRLFFSGSRDKQETLGELAVQRQLHQHKLDIYNSLSADHLMPMMESNPAITTDIRFWMMTLEFGKRYEQMYLGWLEDCVAQIEAI